MRQADREEVHATRWDDSDDTLATQLQAVAGPFGWVAGLDEPIALIGAVQVWPGCWSAWMIATDRFDEIALSVTKHIVRYMDPELRARGAHRLEARSIATHHWAHRWLERCGAKQEAVLKRYGKHGEDFIVFRWD